MDFVLEKQINLEQEREREIGTEGAWSQRFSVVALGRWFDDTHSKSQQRRFELNAQCCNWVHQIHSLSEMVNAVVRFSIKRYVWSMNALWRAIRIDLFRGIHWRDPIPEKSPVFGWEREINWRNKIRTYQRKNGSQQSKNTPIMMPKVRAALCSARHPLAGRIDPSNLIVSMRNV